MTEPNKLAMPDQQPYQTPQVHYETSRNSLNVHEYTDGFRSAPQDEILTSPIEENLDPSSNSQRHLLSISAHSHRSHISKDKRPIDNALFI